MSKLRVSLFLTLSFNRTSESIFSMEPYEIVFHEFGNAAL